MPAKLVHDWIELFLAGKPLHDVEEATSLLVDGSMEPAVPDDRQQILNAADFSQYRVSYYQSIVTYYE